MSTTIVPASISSDVSVTDLGKFLGGEDVPAAPATPAAAPTAQQPEPPAPSAPEAAAVPTPATEPETKPEAQEPSAEEQQEHKEKSWVDRRLSQMAQRRRDAEAVAAHERDRAEQLQRKLDALNAQPGPQPAAEPQPGSEIAKPVAAPGKPELKTFVEALADGEPYELAVGRFTEAVVDWRDQQRVQVAAEQTQQEAFRQDWDAATKIHPDFEDVVERVRQVAPEGLQVAISQIRDKDGKAQWPDVTLYLDEHPDELEAISKQFKGNPYAAVATLGRLVASISPRASTPPPSPGKPALPKPPVVVGGSAAAAPAPIDLEKADMNTFAREVVKYLPGK